ncbi:mesoderm posterior protein 2-like [Pelodytes ibericus]
MDLALTQLNLKDNIMSHEWNPQQQWGYPDSEGYCSLSPASSTDSHSLSPPYESCVFPKETCNNFSTAVSQAENLRSRTKDFPPKKTHKNRGVYKQRQSASEREKMRMRNLSTALQNVRRYLPPAVAPAGKSLTKIETLRLTIRYISHLSEVLGLDEETMVRRREETLRRSSMCPVGLSCCQDRMQEFCPDPRSSFIQTASPSYLSSSPTFCQDVIGFGNMDTGLKQTTLHTTECKASLLVADTQTYSPCALKAGPVHETTQMYTKEQFTGSSPMSPDLGFCQNIIDDMWDELQEKDLWTSFQHPEISQPSQFC